MKVRNKEVKIIKTKVKVFTWSASKNKTIITNGLFNNSHVMTIAEINAKMRAKALKRNKINYKFVY